MKQKISMLTIFGILFGCWLTLQAPATSFAQADAKAKKKKDSKKPANTPPVVKEQFPAVPTKPSNAAPIEVPASQIAKIIDSSINSRLEAEKITPAPQCSDSEFIRRASLDIIGVVPTASRVEQFLADTAKDKRAKLVEELLADARFGQRLADQWGHLMYPMDSDNRFVSKGPLLDWMKEQFNSNRPWDQMAFQLITATGDSETHPETVYYQANRGVDKLTDSVTKLFLGLQLQCAQCHNHPFTSWKQEQYWNVSQFFMKVNTEVMRRKGDEMVGKNLVTEAGKVNRKTNPLPESALSVPAKLPDDATKNLKLDPDQPYRPVLAEWITRKNNPYFAKAFVNRVWESYFGRPITDAADNVEGEASHEDLFEQLPAAFASSGFNIKNLIRGICLSEAYQRSSKPSSASLADHDSYYDRMDLKAMTGEQLFDSLNVVLGDANLGSDKVKGIRVALSGRERFVMFHKAGEDSKPSEFDTGIPQVLQLMNSKRMNAVLPSARQLVQQLGKNPEQIVDRLYLAALARKPSSNEKAMVLKYVAAQPEPTAALSDVLWALLNSSEFILNH